jgi:hypothetical protein
MKKPIIFLWFLVIANFVSGQAKKPTIMVVPSDNWCIRNGYTQTFDELGTLKTLPDYKIALQNETDLLMTIAKINTMMADRGFPLVNLESALKNLERESAEVAMLSSKSGGNIAENPIDVLQRTANADIIIQLTYVINQEGAQEVSYLFVTGSGCILQKTDSWCTRYRRAFIRYSNSDFAGGSRAGTY